MYIYIINYIYIIQYWCFVELDLKFPAIVSQEWIMQAHWDFGQMFFVQHLVNSKLRCLRMDTQNLRKRSRPAREVSGWSFLEAQSWRRGVFFCDFKIFQMCHHFSIFQVWKFSMDSSPNQAELVLRDIKMSHSRKKSTRHIHFRRMSLLILFKHASAFCRPTMIDIFDIYLWQESGCYRWQDCSWQGMAVWPAQKGLPRHATCIPLKII